MNNYFNRQRAMHHEKNWFCTLLFILCALNTQGVRWNIPTWPSCDFRAIYNFGDTNSDTGGISAAFWPIPSPYGISFFQKPVGRYSDGRLIVDFIAEHLGFPYLNAYLDSVGTNFRHGANFAAGLSTVRRQNETIFQNGISLFSLDIQTVQFGQFRARTYDLYNQARHPSERSRLPRPKDFSRALYTLDIGQNDIALGLRMLNNAQIRDAIPDIVNQFAAAVTRLYEQGARAFWIHNTGPIGCLPVYTMYIDRGAKPGVLDEYGCIKNHNALAVEYNKKLKERVIKLRAELPHAALNYVDVYSAKYHLITNAQIYGFRDPMKICCGLHEGKVHVWCGQRAVINGSEIVGGSCGSPDSYISWDGVHYTQAANQWIANDILNGSFSSDPLNPIARACLKP